MCVDGDRTFKLYTRKAGAADTADADSDSETAAAAAAAAEAQYIEGEHELRKALRHQPRCERRGFVVGTDGNCSVRLPPAAGQGHWR